MNLYNYWLKLKSLYPGAVGSCVAYFQQEYQQDWRPHFKDPDEIIRWFESHRIQIITRKKIPGKNRYAPLNSDDGLIRFELTSPEERTTTAFHFSDRSAALYDAIERAMRILEQRAHRDKARIQAYANRNKRVKQKGGEKTLGERAAEAKLEAMKNRL